MLRRLLRDGSERDLLSRLELFKDQPGLLEKYVIASEVTVEVLDLLYSRLFGAESSTNGTAANHEPVSVSNERTNCVSVAAGEGLGERVDWHEAIDGVQRQLAALQRQLKMQGDVTRIAESVNQRLDEVVGTCERLAQTERELREEIHGVDVRGQVESVAADVERLQHEVGGRASAAEVAALAEDVSRLKEAEKKREEMVNGQFDYKGEKPLNGIIAHLTRLCGRNVHKSGFVEVTASGCRDGQPENVADLKNDSQFYTADEPNSWICYDFKGRRVSPTSYSIRSHANSPGGCQPKSWVLEGSNDGSDSSWVKLDQQDGNSALNGSHVTRHFAISGLPHGSFRFIRVRQTGKNHCDRDQLAMSALEIFGTLSDA